MLALYATSALAIVVQQAAITHVDYNFAIFRNAYFHLAAGRDLYAAYPAEQVDLFKYSPTFAVVFAPFAVLPVVAALALWNALNVGLLWYSMHRLLPQRQAVIALALMYLEVLRTTQRAQSNALVAALMVLAFVWLEERKQLPAAAAIAIGASIKIFPALAIIPAVFHPRRVRMSLIAVSAALVALLLPLAVTTRALLQAQYASWYSLEKLDASASVTEGGAGLYGGVMHWVRLAFHSDWPNWWIQAAGLLILAAPLARFTRWNVPGFRLRVLSSILIFSTIFNHQVESPSFAIAMTGIAIWFVTSQRSALDYLLVSVVLLVVSLGSNDLMPRAFRELVVHYKLKTLPCLAVWLVLQAELLGLRACKD